MTGKDTLRDLWYARLCKEGLPEDVVKSFLDELKEDDLLRMKDSDDDVKIVAEELKKALAASEDDPPAVAKDKKDKTDGTTPSGDDGGLDATSLEALISGLGDYIVTKVKDLLPAAIVSDDTGLTDALSKRLDDVVAMIKELTALVTKSTEQSKDLLEGMATSDAQRIKDLAQNLSPAQRARLRVLDDTAGVDAHDVAARVLKNLRERDKVAAKTPGTGPVPTIFDQGSDAPVVIKDAQGNEYESLSEMAFNPK